MVRREGKEDDSWQAGEEWRNPEPGTCLLWGRNPCSGPFGDPATYSDTLRQQAETGSGLGAKACHREGLGVTTADPTGEPPAPTPRPLTMA